MSQDNVQLVHEAAAAVNRRDVEALVDLADPQVEWHAAMPALIGGEHTAYSGHDGIRRMMRDFYETFSEFRVEVSEIHDRGNRIVSVGRLYVRGQASGAESESPIAYVTDVRAGKVFLVRTFLSPAEAFAAAGVTE